MSYPFNLDDRPDGFEALASEPEFDPAKHLQLEMPETIYSLADLGYDVPAIADCPSEFGATSVFRVLSGEGAECLYEVVSSLEEFVSSNPRIERCVRGGVYRSRFLRDLCLSSDVAEFMSGLAGVDLLPHTIPHQLGHLNYAPKEIGKDVDKWHVDTLRYDYVMFVTDPTKNKGGAFQYFKGTKEEIADLKASGRSVPPEKIVAPPMPGPGYAVLQQGNMVVHQAKGLTAPGERVTMVNGYVPRDAAFPDFTRFDQLSLIDPPHVVSTEYARHMAYQGQRLLESEMDARFSSNHSAFAERIGSVGDMLSQAAKEIAKAGQAEIETFGD